MAIETFEEYQNNVLVERIVLDSVTNTCTIFDGEGNEILTRPLTQNEQILLATNEISRNQISNNNIIRANVINAQSQISAWINDHPNGGILTEAQTLVLAKMLNGLCRLILHQFESTDGT